MTSGFISRLSGSAHPQDHWPSRKFAAVQRPKDQRKVTVVSIRRCSGGQGVSREAGPGQPKSSRTALEAGGGRTIHTKDRGDCAVEALLHVAEAAKKMNVDRDSLFLILTVHGSQDGLLSTRDGGEPLKSSPSRRHAQGKTDTITRWYY